MYLATLVCTISMPSLRSSPWIRGAPHNEQRAATHAATYFEKLSGVKSPDKFVQLTMDHTKSAFETFVAEATKIGDLYKDFAKEAFTPFKLKS